MDNATEFLRFIDEPSMGSIDRALALLWFAGRDGSQGLTATEICRVIEEAGHPGQNASRLDKKLATERGRVARVPRSKAWRLSPIVKRQLTDRYESRLDAPIPPPLSDSVLPRTLFANTRGYIEKVVFQINASYDCSLFDCCSVMCRRLLETLIIEVYEAESRAQDIKTADGHFYMLSDLIRVLLADKAFNLGRNTQAGLRDFKKLGDLSAHNRRFNAGRDDIDRVRDGLRVAAEELLHIARLI